MSYEAFSLTERVNSSNITELSLTAAFCLAARKQPTPSKDEIYEEILDKFSFRKKLAENFSQKESLKRNEKKFVRIINSELPEGFEIAPVLFSEAEKRQRELVAKEYHRTNKAFLKFIWENHQNEIVNLGFDKNFLNAIKTGHFTNVKNPPYEASIDHIMERFCGGVFTLMRTPDPVRQGRPKSFIINQFNNLVLLPHPIHKLKNDLNGAQVSIHSNKQEGYSNGIWYLMLVPKSMPGMSGFVCPPQPNKKFGIFTESYYTKTLYECAYDISPNKMETIEEKLKRQEAHKATMELVKKKKEERFAKKKQKNSQTQGSCV